MKKNVLEIPWHSNEEAEKAVYHVEILVKKVKLYMHRPSGFFYWMPKSQWQEIRGQIIHCDIELTEKELLISLPHKNQDNVNKGDILNLAISEKGWCIEVKKNDPN
jgi:hypothetical protein